MSRRLELATLVALALGCGDRAASERSAGAHVEEASPPAAPAESLVVSTGGGAEIWYTLARADSGANGRCVARAIEIRHDGRRVPVPLLYTSTTPEIVNDTTIRARLSDHCAPGDSYLVDLRTGRPVRER